MRASRLILVSVCCPFWFATTVAVGEPPPIFAENDLEKAQKEAAETGKLLLVDATAVWCMPCKKMDRTTWVDPSVVAWLEDHGVAVQFDVDDDKKLARELEIQAMPTVIVFRDGAEFDRVVGYQTAEQLLEWLDGVQVGRRAIDALREAAGDRSDPEGNVDIRARLSLARTLAQRGKLDEATEEYAWLWQNMLKFEPSMRGVRLSFMVGDMSRLAKRHTPALEKFRQLRDRYSPLVNAATDGQAASDWVALNKVIGDEASTLKWYERVKDDPAAARAVEQVGRNLFKMLVERKRWKDAGLVFRDPVQTAQRRLQVRRMAVEQIPEDDRAQMKQYMRRTTRRHLSQLYAAALAAGRDDAADEIAALLLEEQDDEKARFALVQVALQARQPRSRHLEWLSQAEAMGHANPLLQKELESALPESG